MTGRTEQAKSVFLSLLMVLSVIAIGSAGFAGSAAAFSSSDITAVDDVVLGSEGQSLTSSKDLIIAENTAGEFGGSGSGEITLSDPVTFNTSESAPTVRAVTNGSISKLSFSSDNQTLNFETDFKSGSETKINFGDLVVDVPNTTGSSFDLDVRAGTATATKTIDTTSPVMFIDSANGSVPDVPNQVSVGAASSSEAFGIVINSSETNLSQPTDGHIGKNTDIIVEANASKGLTFDTRVGPTQPSSLDFQDGAVGKLDLANVSYEAGGERLVVPTTDSFNNDENVTIRGLKLNASGSASDGKLSVKTTPTASSGTVTTLSKQKVQVTKPSLSVNINSSAAVGKDRTGDVAFDISSQTGGDIGANTKIEITTNNSEVTFARNGTDEDDDLDPVRPNNGGVDSIVNDNATVNSNNITLVTEGASSGSEVINFTKIDFNVTNVPAEGEDVNFTVTTRGSTGGTPITATDTAVLDLERPDNQFNGGSDFSTKVDNDGQDGVEIGNDGGSTALKVTSDDIDQVSSGTYVNLTLEGGTGVTFNTSAVTKNIDNGETDGPGAIGVQSSDTNDVENITITKDTFAIGLSTGHSGLQAGENIQVDQLFVNVTSDASNTTLDVVTNTGDSTVTTDVAEKIVVEEATPSKIKANANTSGGNTLGSFGADESPENSEDNPIVGETVTGEVRVQNGGPGFFGDADVDLEIVETPEGSSGASLNTSTVTTFSNGKAQFNFTAGDVANEDYVVNATISGTTGAGNTGVNITYSPTSAEATSISVTPIEDAISGSTLGPKEEVGTAAVYVNATDEFGNPVGSGVSGKISIESGSPTNFNISDATNASGMAAGDKGSVDSSLSTDSSDITLDDDGSSVVTFEASSPQDVELQVTFSGNSDTGAVTFYDSVGAVDTTLNESTAIVGDQVAANATLLEDTGGTQITVPDITVNFGDGSSANTTVTGTAVTDDSGVASSTVTADAEGTSNISATENLRSDEAVLTIDQPSLAVSTNVSEVTVDNETDVLTTVTYARNDTAVEGATVNVSGAGVSVSEQPTDADGNATFTVNASESGDITVNATKSGTNAAETTITAAAETVPATFDVSEVSPDGATVTVGDAITVTADVENTGDESGEQTVEFRLDTDDNGTLEADEELANKSVSLDSGENTTVTFEDVSTDALPNETITYDHGVFSEDDEDTATVTVEALAGDGGTVDIGDFSVPSEYVTDGGVTPDDLGDAAADFRAGDLTPGELGDVAGGFRNS
jgi:surface glycoprotein (TIGR04207 family)